MNAIESIKKSFFSFLTDAYTLSPEQQGRITFELHDDPKKQSFGDIATNAALIVAKELQQQPRRIAEDIKKNFSHDAVAEIAIAGPGFLNFSITPDSFEALAKELFTNHNEFFKLAPDAPRNRYNVEFVSANPTGPLHLGHGRGGIIGDVLGTIMRFVGHHVTKEYYINDAGVQIKKLGMSFKIRCEQELGRDIQLPEESYHGTYLVDLAKTVITENKKAVEQALADDDMDFFERTAEQHMLAAIKETLTLYGIQFDVWFSERVLYIDGAVEAALTVLEQRNFTYFEDGALWFKSTAFGDDKDRVLKKSNGEYTYMSADVAYMNNKFERGAEKLIMILGQDHHSYVDRLKAAAQALGHDADALNVILYQLVTLKESGQQMRLSKRAGRIVSLKEIIDAVGTDVARFFYLNRKADAHLDFDIDLALKHTEENPVYYIQYAYVRTKSIMEKAELNAALQNITADDLGNFTEHEQLLLKKIISLKTMLENICQNYYTHLLAYYTLELAHSFHSYYSSHKVIDTQNIPTSRNRLALIAILQQTFELCLTLLGLSCPEKM